MRLRPALALFLPAVLMLAGHARPAVAQDRIGYVLVTTKTAGGDLPQARADGLAVSRAMIGAGVTVMRRENADPADFTFGAVAPLTILYFSGPTRVEAGETWLLAPDASGADSGRPEGWPLGATVRALRARGAAQVVAVVQGCHRPGQGFAVLPPRPGPSSPTGAGDASHAPEDPLADTLFLLSADPAQGCPGTPPEGPRLTARFLEALGSGAPDLAAAVADLPGEGWEDSRLVHRLPAPVAQIAPDGSAARQTDRAALLRSLPPEQAADLAALWQTLDAIPRAGQAASPLIAPGEGDGAPLPSASASAPRSAALSPASSAAVPAGARPAPAGGLRIVDVSARALLAARPTAAGLPRPSVIVGEIAPAALRPDDPDAASPLMPTLLDLSPEARAAMRAEDGAAFARLVESGAFDPAPVRLVSAIQTELQRMGCYGAGIDGQWGNGSRAAVGRYYAQRGTPAPTREPTLVLWRDMLGAEDVACPAPARTAAPARTTPPGNTAPTTSAPPSAPPSAQPPAAPAGGIDAGALGRGVMR